MRLSHPHMHNSSVWYIAWYVAEADQKLLCKLNS